MIVIASWAVTMQIVYLVVSNVQAVEDEDAMINILGCVHDLLGKSRKVIWDLAARRVRDLLSGPAAFEGEHFLQVNFVFRVNYPLLTDDCHLWTL